MSESILISPAVSGDAQKNSTISTRLRGRVLFDSNITFDFPAKKFEAGAKIKTTSLTDTFTYEDFQRQYGDKAIPLFKLVLGAELTVFATDSRIIASQGQIVISLIASG